jgi:hypothetical protein
MELYTDTATILAHKTWLFSSISSFCIQTISEEKGFSVQIIC